MENTQKVNMYEALGFLAKHARQAKSDSAKTSAEHKGAMQTLSLHCLLTMLFGSLKDKALMNKAFKKDGEFFTERMAKSRVQRTFLRLDNPDNNGIAFYVKGKTKTKPGTEVRITLAELKEIWENYDPLVTPACVGDYVFSTAEAYFKALEDEYTEVVSAESGLINTYLEITGTEKAEFNKICTANPARYNEALDAARMYLADQEKEEMASNLPDILADMKKKLDQLKRINGQAVDRWIAELHMTDDDEENMENAA